MNTYAIAELTALLAHRGLHQRLRVQEAFDSRQALIIQDRRHNKPIVAIRPDPFNGSYIASNGRITPDCHGNTPAQALARFLDNHPKYGQR